MQWFLYKPERQRQRDIKLLTHLVDDVKARTVAGSIPDCLATQALANQEKSGMSDVEIAYALSTPFGAGIDTASGFGPFTTSVRELDNAFPDKCDDGVFLP